ncbi:penicillin-binding protein 2 [Lujinxingia litoralis]|uniref:Penicillin-binding protein 2 n=1 Tax=Lujinxingia litoralis TaxID=2211119 RepID=A0A328C931_9DELT|nr:penicillin-binding protein 2 [Lujinxingia litoralis]RAL23504.1 penicillin-binding protein 2 [Lujinxingia litoralis]
MAIRELPKRGRRGELAEYDQRYGWALAVVLLAFGMIALRLWQLQVVEGERYYRAATENIIRQVEVSAPRGKILDRNGVALAENRPSFDVYMVPHIFRRHADETSYELLRQYMNLSDGELTRIRSMVESNRGEQLIRRDISRLEVARLEEDRLRLPGIEVRAQAHRHYPLHHVGGHAVGFVAEVGRSELRDLAPYGYRAGDRVGRMGLERAFEEVLHGSPGLDRVVVDARGNRQGESQTRFLIGEYQRVEPVAGRDVVSTLDADLMVIIDEAMRKYAAGAVVAIDPRDGAVRALYSKPHFNPNAWSGRLSAMEKMRSDNDPFKPMLDKTVSAYFPGSVYKIVGTWAALHDHIYEPHDEVDCPGYYNFGGRRWRCHKWGGHGDVDAYTSMAMSCDVYFYQLAEEMGMDRMAEFARRFGFGERSGLPINHESAGRIPDTEWYRQHGPDGYTRGMDLNSVLGQGDTLTTPLQMALAYAAIANGGDLYYPRLVEEIRNAGGETIFEYEPRVRKTLGIEPEHLEVLRKSLWMGVEDDIGTASRVRLSHTQVAGKTGTAQVAKIGAVRVANRDKEIRLRDHAWFAAYAPYENPELVLVVFLEHAGSGGKEAAPVAMEIYDRYFTRDDDYDALSLRVGQKALPEAMREPSAPPIEEPAQAEEPVRDEEQ